MEVIPWEDQKARKAVPLLRKSGGLCTVNTLAQLTGTDFVQTAVRLTAASWGTSGTVPGYDMALRHYITALEHLEHELREIPSWAWFGRTVRTFARNAPKGRYMVLVRDGRHVLPVIDNRVLDWSANSLIRVSVAWEFVK